MTRWIVKGRLGTAPYSEDLRGEATVIDVRELVDRAGNDPHAIRRKVDEGVVALNGGATVIVACDMGISRSNAIAAGILAKWRRVPYDAALDEVVSSTRESSIKLDVISAVRRALFDDAPTADAGRVMVTGATGFLGCNVLAREHDRIELFAPRRDELDLLGAASQLERYCRERGIGQILHLAHPRVFTTNESLGQSLTILKNLIDVCRVVGIRLILPSGAVVFSGYQSSGRSVFADTEPWPKGIYGETKFLQEGLVRTAVRNGDIEATIVRIAPTYGPGGDRPRLIRFFYRSLLEKRPIVTHLYRDATPARLDLLYIDDAVSGLERVLGDRALSIYHLAPAASYTPREVAGRMAVLLGVAPEFNEMPIDEYASNIFLESTESRRELGWESLVHIDEGLTRTMEAFS